MLPRPLLRVLPIFLLACFTPALCKAEIRPIHFLKTKVLRSVLGKKASAACDTVPCDTVPCETLPCETPPCDTSHAPCEKPCATACDEGRDSCDGHCRFGCGCKNCYGAKFWRTVIYHGNLAHDFDAAMYKAIGRQFAPYDMRVPPPYVR